MGRGNKVRKVKVRKIKTVKAKSGKVKPVLGFLLAKAIKEKKAPKSRPSRRTVVVKKFAAVTKATTPAPRGKVQVQAAKKQVLRGKVQTLQVKKLELKARAKPTIKKQLTTSRVPKTTAAKTVPQSTGPVSTGNQSRGQLLATRRRVQTSNFGISGQSPLN